VLVPRPEPAGPASGDVHASDDDVLAAHPPHQLDDAVHQHPPEVGVLALLPQLDARLDRDLLAVVDQLGELPVGQPVEERDRAQVADPDHVMAR
jgi:hypothetical protein